MSNLIFSLKRKVKLTVPEIKIKEGNFKLE
jgi:hypothetical protein